MRLDFTVSWILIFYKTLILYNRNYYKFISLMGSIIAEISEKVSTFVKFQRHLWEKMPEIPVTRGDNPRRDRVFCRYGKPYEWKVF